MPAPKSKPTMPPPPPPPKPRRSSPSMPSLESDANKKRSLENATYPSPKRQKVAVAASLRKKVMDPRLIRNAKPTKIVYKRRKNMERIVYFEWNLNVAKIARNIEGCLDKIIERKSLKSVCGAELLSLC